MYMIMHVQMYMYMCIYIIIIYIPYNTYFSLGIYFRLFPRWAVNRKNITREIITREKMFSRLSL